MIRYGLPKPNLGEPRRATMWMGERLLCEIEPEATGRLRIYAELRAKLAADAHDVDLIAMAQALKEEFEWTLDDGLALAATYAFKVSPTMLDARFAPVERKGPGRPPALDDTTLAIWKLARAWVFVTGAQPSYGERSLFVRAVEAVLPFIPCRARERTGADPNQIRALIRAEAKKFVNAAPILVRPKTLPNSLPPGSWFPLLRWRRTATPCEVFRKRGKHGYSIKSIAQRRVGQHCFVVTQRFQHAAVTHRGGAPGQHPDG